MLLGACALAAGCGSGRPAEHAERNFERKDLVAVARALQALHGPVSQEVKATKAAWPRIAHGLPAEPAPADRAAIAAAAQSAAAIRLPPILSEAWAARLTGPASALAGVVRTYALLSARGWRMIAAALEGGGPEAGSRFARENVGLYIESVYDGHFTLAQLGKKLRDGYERLGGAGAFGSALSQANLETLADAYSEAADRLHPHVSARLGA